jgi:putative ABC transport system permease protein
MWKQHAFVGPAILSFALAVGSNTAIFSIVDALWFRPLHILNADSVVIAYQPVVNSSDGEVRDTVQRRSREALKNVRAMSDVAFEVSTNGLTGDWAPIVRLAADGPIVRTRAVSYNYFDVLGVRVRGRSFSPDDDQYGAAPVIVISERYWKATLAADANAVGGTLRTTRGPLTIVGVVDTAFDGARIGDQIDLWMSLGCLSRFSDLAARREVEGLMPLTMLGRLRNGVSVWEAQAQVRSILGPDTRLRTLRDVAFPLRAEGDLRRQRTLFVILGGVAVLVLALGCANVAALFLARTAARSREFVVRLSLGCTAGLLMWSVLAEVAVLAAAGVAVGLFARWLMLESVAQLRLPSGVAIQSLGMSLHWHVCLLGGVVAFVTGAVAALMAVRQARLFETRGSGERVARASLTLTRGPRYYLLAAHVSVSVVLIILAAAYGATVIRAFRTDTGFDMNETVFAGVRPKLTQYVDADSDLGQLTREYRVLLDRLGALPGVSESTYGPALLKATEEPPQPSRITTGDKSRQIVVAVRSAGPRYLTALGATFVAGRDLDERDDAHAANIPAAMGEAFGKGQRGATALVRSAAVVDEALADRLWPGESPLGRQFSFGYLNLPYEVVGVIGSIRHGIVSGDVIPTLVTYRRLADETALSGLDVVLRGETPDALVRAARLVIYQVFPDPTVVDVRTAREVIAGRTSAHRLTATMVSWYAIVAAVLGVVGVVSVVRYMMACCRRELATRIALGATPSQLRRLVMFTGMKPVLVGTSVGTCCAVLVTNVAGLLTAEFIKPGLLIYCGTVAIFIVAGAVATGMASAGAGALSGTLALRSE